MTNTIEVKIITLNNDVIMTEREKMDRTYI